MDPNPHSSQPHGFFPAKNKKTCSFLLCTTRHSPIGHKCRFTSNLESRVDARGKEGKEGLLKEVFSPLLSAVSGIGIVILVVILVVVVEFKKA